MKGKYDGHARGGNFQNSTVSLPVLLQPTRQAGPFAHILRTLIEGYVFNY